MNTKAFHFLFSPVRRCFSAGAVSLLLTLFGLSCQARATLLYSDNFDYSDGSTVSGSALNGNGAGAVDAFGGAWVTSSVNGTETVGSGALQITPTASGVTAAYRPLGTTLGALETASGSTTLWIGYKIDISTVGNRVIGMVLDSGYSSPSSAGTQVLFAGKGSVSSYTTDGGTTATYDGTTAFDVSSATVGSTSHNAVSGTSLVANTPYELLTEINFSLSQITFYAVPVGSLPGDVSGLTGGVTLTANSVNFTSLASVNALLLQAGFSSGAGSTTSIGSFDSLDIGTTYADVVAVPEMATWEMTGLGFLFLVGMARGRRRALA